MNLGKVYHRQLCQDLLHQQVGHKKNDGWYLNNEFQVQVHQYIPPTEQGE